MHHVRQGRYSNTCEQTFWWSKDIQKPWIQMRPDFRSFKIQKIQSQQSPGIAHLKHLAASNTLQAKPLFTSPRTHQAKSKCISQRPEEPGVGSSVWMILPDTYWSMFYFEDLWRVWNRAGPFPLLSNPTDLTRVSLQWYSRCKAA